MNYKVFCKTRSKLQYELFTGKPAYAGHLMEMNNHSYDFHTQQAISQNLVLREGKPHEKDEFIRDAKTERTEAFKKYEEIIEKISKVVENTVKEVLDNTKIKETEDVEEDKIGKQSKQKPMNQIRREKEEKKRRKELALKDKDKLRNFIRLGDYMVIEGLYKTVMRAAENINQGIMTPVKTGLFVTILSKEVFFEPNCQDITNTVLLTLEEIGKCVKSCPRVIERQCFDQFTKEPPPSPDLEPQLIITSSLRYIFIRDEVVKKVSKDFAEAQNIVLKINNMCKPIMDDMQLSSKESVEKVLFLFYFQNFFIHLTSIPAYYFASYTILHEIIFNFVRINIQFCK